jgi:hypothetical protein
MTSGSPGSAPNETPAEALLVLVGITAGRRQRKRVLDVLRRHGGFDVLVPHIPYRRSLVRAASWLEGYLDAVLERRNYRAVHVLNYIGGGYLFRKLGSRLSRFPLGRVVHVRSPLQEQVPLRLAQRFTRPGLLLIAGRSAVDMAAAPLDDLPLPRLGHEQGLIVETRQSAMARWLGVEPAGFAATAWSHARLLPDAADAIDLPVSHDEAYGPGEVLRQFLHFVEHGRFEVRPSGLSQAAAEADPR